jgi:hypothetical protein
MRRLLRVTAAAVAGLLVLTLLGQPAHAASGYPPCGPTCDGKDPQRDKLAYLSPYWYCYLDGTTVAQVEYGTWRAELRYSNRCETTWARVIDLNNEPPPVFWRLRNLRR